MVKLTLRSNSFLFLEDMQLSKGVPQEVDETKLSASQVKTLNRYITAGIVDSSAGALKAVVPTEAAKTVAPVSEEAKVEAETEVEVSLEAVATEADTQAEEAPEVKKPATPVRRTARKTTTAKK